MSQGYSLSVAEGIANADGNLIGVQLGRFCLDRGIPVSEVANALIVSRQTLYAWFSGAVQPRAGMEAAIRIFMDSFGQEMNDERD